MIRILRASVLVAITITLIVLPPALLACEMCKYSPNGWGFCRGNYNGGYEDGSCTEKVIDQWTGQTDCEFSSAWASCNWVNPPISDGGGTGGGSDDGCYMTTLVGHGCLIYY